MNDLNRQLAIQKLNAPMMIGALGRQLLAGQQPGAAGAPGGAPGTGGALSGAGAAGGATDLFPGAGVEQRLINVESGGRANAVAPSTGALGTYQFTPGLLQSIGMFKPDAQGAQGGADRWSGSFNIPDSPDVKSAADFLANPTAQRTAFKAAMAYNDQLAQQRGLYSQVGQTINGVPVTRDGVLAGMWLGGPGGVSRWLSSGGQDNATDANNTGVGKYIALGWDDPTTKLGNAAAAAHAGVTGPPPLITPGVIAAIQLRAMTDPGGAAQQLAELQQKASEQAHDVPISWPEANARLSGGAQPGVAYTMSYPTMAVKPIPLQEHMNPLPDAVARQVIGPSYREGVSYGIDQTGKPVVLAEPPRTSLLPPVPGVGGGPVDPRVGEATNQANTAVRGDPAYQLWSNSAARYNSLVDFINNPTRLQSQLVLSDMQKILSPTTGMTDADRDEAGLWSGVYGKLQELLSKGADISSLTPQARKDLWTAAQQAMATRDIQLARVLSGARSMAPSQGVNPANVLPGWVPTAATEGDNARQAVPVGGSFNWAPKLRWDDRTARVVRDDTPAPGAPGGPPLPDALAARRAQLGVTTQPPPAAPTVASPPPVAAPALAPAATVPPVAATTAPQLPPPAPVIPPDEVLSKMTLAELRALAKAALANPGAYAPGEVPRLTKAYRAAQARGGGY
jgi:hypothetical protein